jgi:hypothetical protein
MSLDFGLRVSVTKYYELQAYGNTYRIDHIRPENIRQRGFFQRWSRTVQVNNVKINLPFEDKHGVRIYMAGINIYLETQFGLTIESRQNYWDFAMRLCGDYSGFICGLNGNGNGNQHDDYVDRENNLIGGHYWNNLNRLRWAHTWFVYDPNDTELDFDGRK